MRALAVLPKLVERHEVLILAGADAYRALLQDYDVTRLPVFEYFHKKDGTLSNWRTFWRNISGFLDLKLHGHAVTMVCDVLEKFRPDVVVTDSEGYSHAAAKLMRIPRISFDRFGLLVYCRPEVRGLDRLALRGNAWVYRRLFGEPDRVVITSFFPAPPRRPGVVVVGPVIRDEVRRIEPTDGDHLLVYISRGQNEYTPKFEQALLSYDGPVRIYGTPRRGLQENLQFKPIANLPFLEDLASCRAVISTTGNQLSGEVMYFGKPMLGMPIACLEQRLNAYQLEKNGTGMYVPAGKVDADVLRRFLSREDEFRANLSRQWHDGAVEAVEAIERFARELAGSKTDDATDVVNAGAA